MTRVDLPDAARPVDMRPEPFTRASNVIGSMPHHRAVRHGFEEPMCPPAPRWLRRIWLFLEKICAVHLERAPSGRRYAPPILCGGSHGGEQAEINWSAHGFL